MRALSILFGGNLTGKAFEPLLNGKNSVSLAVEQAKQFPGTGKVALFASDGDFSFLNDVQIERRDNWTKRSLLEKISELQAGFDCAYFAFADCPFLDPVLGGKIAGRHLRYAAEYSYADGWPYGLAPEVLSPGTAGILAKILGDDDGPVERDILFSVIQKDINAFDIEAEISPVDFRCHRLNFCADTKRNLLLLDNFIDAANGKIPILTDVQRIITEQPEILRTLPAFYPIQVYGGCPQKCAICPYPSVTDTSECKDFMTAERFEELLEKITAFSEDAVIDISLWGEAGLHTQKMRLIESVLKREELSLVIETSGLGWKDEDLERCAALELEITRNAAARKTFLPPLSWIVSLDTADPQRYMQLRGGGFADAQTTAKKLFSLFQKNCYVQAVRVSGGEDDTEKFYRYWKDHVTCGNAVTTGNAVTISNAVPSEKNIIIQKYDDFCGFLEKKQASDISPLLRKPCWHIMRDMPVLTDGTVPLCRENLAALKDTNAENILGNVFTDSLEKIWRKGARYYAEQCKENYMEICLNCDEYYTFNF